MNKETGFCMLFSVVALAFILFSSFKNGVYESTLVSGMITPEVDAMTSGGTSRILKENMAHSIFGGEIHGGDLSLEDYHPFDPSPSSKASIRPGPIQHGTPLNPYIPAPNPSPAMPSDDDQSP